MSVDAAPQDCARVMPDTLRLKLAWQQHFLDEDWVLESYSTEDSMPKACQQGAGPSARLCNADRHAIFSWTSYCQSEHGKLGNAHRLCCGAGTKIMLAFQNSAHVVHTAVASYQATCRDFGGHEMYLKSPPDLMVSRLPIY